ncbi:MAG: hypothetical protein KGQ66_20725 [Acidobacteriota bacterium]|nr:hypothetical protein [Acidobacteriota bacterium]
MLISFVLRVDADRLSSGELVGEVEHVEAGAREPLRSVDELVSRCQGLEDGLRSATGDQK